MALALGVIAPLPIHQKTIIVRARFQWNACPPDTFSFSMHIDGSLIPVGKIADQLHFFRIGRSERKNLHLEVFASAPGVLYRSLCIILIIFTYHFCSPFAAGKPHASGLYF